MIMFMVMSIALMAPLPSDRAKPADLVELGTRIYLRNVSGGNKLIDIEPYYTVTEFDGKCVSVECSETCGTPPYHPTIGLPLADYIEEFTNNPRNKKIYESYYRRKGHDDVVQPGSIPKR